MASDFLFSVFDKFTFVPQPNIPFRPLHGWGRSSFANCLFYKGCRIYLMKCVVHVSNILRRGNFFGALHYLHISACLSHAFSDVQCCSMKHAPHIFSSSTCMASACNCSVHSCTLHQTWSICHLGYFCVFLRTTCLVFLYSSVISNVWASWCCIIWAVECDLTSRKRLCFSLIYLPVTGRGCVRLALFFDLQKQCRKFAKLFMEAYNSERCFLSAKWDIEDVCL